MTVTASWVLWLISGLVLDPFNPQSSLFTTHHPHALLAGVTFRKRTKGRSLDKTQPPIHGDYPRSFRPDQYAFLAQREKPIFSISLPHGR